MLRVGFISSAANEATQQIIAAFARRRPDWRVDMRQAAWSDATAGLASGDADVALLRLPFPGQDDVHIEVLLTEPRWVALPATHPLGVQDQISFHQLWDEPFIAAPTETGLWRDYWLATDERQGHPVCIGAVTDQPDAFVTAIANGYGVALVPESAARYYARPGITYRPVAGVSPSQVAVAWPPNNDTNPVVQDFVSCCLDTKPSADPLDLEGGRRRTGSARRRTDLGTLERAFGGVAVELMASACDGRQKDIFSSPTCTKTLQWPDGLGPICALTTTEPVQPSCTEFHSFALERDREVRLDDGRGVDRPDPGLRSSGS